METDATLDAYGDGLAAARSLEDALVREAEASGTVVRLGDLASKRGIQIGPFGSQLHAHEYTVDGVPVVMPSDLTSSGLTTEGIRRVSDATADRLRLHRLQPNDILLPRRGDLDKRALVTKREQGWLCGTGSVRVRLDDPDTAPLVERLLAGRESVRWLLAHAVGTTMPNLNADIVARIPLRMPGPKVIRTYTAQLNRLPKFGAELQSARTSLQFVRRTLIEKLLRGR